VGLSGGRGAIPPRTAAHATAAAQIPTPGQLLPLADADARGLQPVCLADGGPVGRWRREPEALLRGGRLGVVAPIQAKPPRQQRRPSGRPFRFPRQGRRPQQHPVGPVAAAGDHIHAVMNAVAHINVKTPRLTKQRFVAGGAAAVAVASGVVLGIRLRFHHHAPKQAAVLLAFHQQAADELGGDELGGAGEEGWGEVLGGRGGYGSG